MIPKRIKVKYSKLGRTGAVGLSYGNFKIEIDARLKGKEFLDTMIHECLHELFPEAYEEEIDVKATIMANTLWQENIRRIDNEHRYVRSNSGDA